MPTVFFSNNTTCSITLHNEFLDSIIDLESGKIFHTVTRTKEWPVIITDLIVNSTLPHVQDIFGGRSFLWFSFFDKVCPNEEILRSFTRA